MAGGNMGGSLGYHAVCMGAQAKTIACDCLYDFRDAERFRVVFRLGFIAPRLRSLVGVLALVLPPTGSFIALAFM
ncbi:MAG: hypothetical protein ACOCVQ_00370 [Bacillota bacterium]